MKKVFILFLVMLGFTAIGQETEKKQALLIIDVQEFYFPGGKWELKNPEQAAKNASLLLAHFREKGWMVIHVRHNTEPGGNIHKIVEPLSDEEVITKDEVNSFKDTQLRELLFFHDISDLVLCGMQTHMCLEAATRAGADYNFTCTVIGDACATRDLTYGDRTVKAEDVHSSTLSTLKSYARVMDTEEYLKEGN